MSSFQRTLWLISVVYMAHSNGLFTAVNHHVIQLNTSQHEDTISSMQNGDLFVVQYSSEDCLPCQSFNVHFINFARFIHHHQLQLTQSDTSNDLNGNYKYRIKCFTFINVDTTLPVIDLYYTTTNDNNNARAPHSVRFNVAQDATAQDLYAWFKQQLHALQLQIVLQFLPSIFLDEHCLNSRNGPYRIADSKGWICNFDQVNPRTKCCAVLPVQDDDTHSSSSVCTSAHCDAYFPCCDDYENCIACCLHQLNPYFDGETLPYQFYALEHNREKWLELESTHFQNFTFCRHQCRTTSQSTFEGNVYVRHRFYHCYESNIARYEEPQQWLKYIAPNRHFEVQLSNRGESCAEACVHAYDDDDDDDAIRKECVNETQLTSILNSCIAFANNGIECSRGCQFGFDSFLPALDATESTTTCYLQATMAQNDAYSSCTAKHRDYQRLCLCEIKAKS